MKTDNKLYNNFDHEKYYRYYEDVNSLKCKKNLFNHYQHIGKYENRIFFSKTDQYNVLNNYYMFNYPINTNIKSDIIISLSVLPNRLLSKQFEQILERLVNQVCKPKNIIINVCHEYKRFFEYDKESFNNKLEEFKNKYKIIINFTEDFGPITKILGLKNLQDMLNPNDKIIILDDDYLYKNYLTYYYELIYNLYNCEAVFIDAEHILSMAGKINKELINYIFHDNYQGKAFGWTSFSIKYKYIEDLYNFYKNIILIDDKIINHDDLIITLFYKSKKIYAGAINLLLTDFGGSELNTINSLTSDEMQKSI